MNCIILLLLLSCCGGWGGSGCAMTCNDNCCGRGGSTCGRDMDKRKPDRRDFRERHGDCGCKEERPGRDECDCGCPKKEHESCDVPGMIPPPWQEYPAFPRRDNREDCDSDK